MIGPVKPKVPKRYYAQYTINGWVVMDRERYASRTLHIKHSTHNTREEAEAVALALNELTG